MGRSAKVPMLRARLALPIVVELRRRGLDVGAVLARIGHDEERFRTLDGRISLEAFAELCLAARDASGDASLPLDAVTRIDRGAFPVELHLVSSQATMRDGMEFVAPFIATMIDGLELSLRPHEDEALAVFTIEDAPLGPPALAEYVLLALWSFVLRMAPTSPPPIEIHLAHATPAFGRSLAELVATDVRYGSPYVGFVFAWENIDIPVAGADPHLGRALVSLASTWSAATTTLRVRDRARRWLTANLAGEEPTTERLAGALHLSDRSLRRHLESEGTSLRKLLDEVRREHADVLLAAHGTSLDDVAHALGFSSANAFGRAYRRWYGRAPSEAMKESAKRRS